ncbi:MAG: hypothetical protein H7296_00650 [Bacteroidia bacterium]|nr:hypothetical protein [Bacteroidia bacterium]
MQFGVAFTELKQLLFYFPFQVFFNNEYFLVYEKGGYYIYNYLFYGIGNLQSPPQSETYSVTFPRVRLNVLKRV